MLDLDKFQDVIDKIPRGRAGSCSRTMFHFKLSQVKGKKNTMPCHWNSFVSWRKDAESLASKALCRNYVLKSGYSPGLNCTYS